MNTCLYIYSFIRKKLHEQWLNSEDQQETDFDVASQFTTKKFHILP